MGLWSNTDVRSNPASMSMTQVDRVRSATCLPIANAADDKCYIIGTRFLRFAMLRLASVEMTGGQIASGGARESRKLSTHELPRHLSVSGLPAIVGGGRTAGQSSIAALDL